MAAAKPYSKEEIDYLRKYHGARTVKQLAEDLGRKPSSVKGMIRRYINKENKRPASNKRVYKVASIDTNSIEWKNLKEEFNVSELGYFEQKFAKLITQFRDDITPTEESQIFQLIRFDLLMHRNMALRKKIMEELETNQQQIRALYMKGADNRSDAENELLDTLQKANTAMLNSQKSFAQELNSYQERYDKIMEDLKGTRNQRLARAESNKQTFVDLVRSIQDEKFRDREGHQLAMMYEAVKKETKRLGDPHKFLDNAVDIPILNSETIEEYEGHHNEESSADNGSDGSNGVLPGRTTP